HLAERDRRGSQRSIRVGDRDAGILPTLVDQAAAVSAPVVEVAVAVAVAEALDPLESRIDVAAQLAYQRRVPGPCKVLVEENEKERSRIHGTVVGGALRNAPEPRQRTLAKLVRNLSGLRVAIRIAAIGLMMRQHARGISGNGGAEAADLERRDGGITAEQGREPRDAAGDVALAAVQWSLQELQIEEAPPDDALDDGIAADLDGGLEPVAGFPLALVADRVGVPPAAD